MNKLFYLLLICSFLYSACDREQYVFISPDVEGVQAAYAVRKLSETLTGSGYILTPDEASADYQIHLQLADQSLKEEAFEILPEAGTIKVNGGDQRGLIYGALALSLIHI